MTIVQASSCELNSLGYPVVITKDAITCTMNLEKSNHISDDFFWSFFIQKRIILYAE